MQFSNMWCIILLTNRQKFADYLHIHIYMYIVPTLQCSPNFSYTCTYVACKNLFFLQNSYFIVKPATITIHCAGHALLCMPHL